MTIIIFIIVLFVCVIAHEWGHFAAAKKSGMLVEEFGFGIPPKIWGFKRGETLYSINALPIGGFVKIAGENGPDNNIPTDRQFDSKPWYTKSFVLVAGVICNVILAFILFTASYVIGLPTVTPDGIPTVTNVVDGSPSAKAGIATGDTVQSVRVGNAMITPLDTETLHDAIVKSGGDVMITYTHQNEHHTATIVPNPQTKLIGLGLDPIGIVRQSLGSAMHSAVVHMVALGHLIVVTIGTLVGGLFHGHGTTEGLIGPVGLAKAVGSAATFGFAYLLAFTASISLNLAVLNIMPFPALDGGRLVVIWGEALTRRKFSKTTVGIIHAVGFIVLIGLMVWLTIGDVRRAL